jgi:hypothetical protein
VGSASQAIAEHYPIRLKAAWFLFFTESENPIIFAIFSRFILELGNSFLISKMSSPHSLEPGMRRFY